MEIDSLLKESKALFVELNSFYRFLSNASELEGAIVKEYLKNEVSGIIKRTVILKGEKLSDTRYVLARNLKFELEHLGIIGLSKSINPADGIPPHYYHHLLPQEFNGDLFMYFVLNRGEIGSSLSHAMRKLKGGILQMGLNCKSLEEIDEIVMALWRKTR